MRQLDPESLRGARISLGLSQEDFAAAIRAAGSAAGEPNGCNKRHVQKWESGEHTRIRASYQRALEAVTGMTYSQLCAPFTPVSYADAAARIGVAVHHLRAATETLATLERELLAAGHRGAPDLPAE